VLNQQQKQILDKAFESWATDVISVAQVHNISAQTAIGVRLVEWFALDKGIIPARYQRNIGSIGIDGQKKLLESSCLIIGLGGLGGFVCEELARLGAGLIAAVDFDSFEQTNLNRQLHSKPENLGGKKTVETKNRIKKINSAVEFSGFDSKFNELPEQVWQGTDIVFDCLDNIEDRLKLAHKCSELNKPLIHGAVAGWYGEVGVLWPQSDTLDKIYKNQMQGMEKKLGTPVFTVATAAGIMVSEGVKILAGRTTKKERKIHFFDLMQDIWQTVTM